MRGLPSWADPLRRSDPPRYLSAFIESSVESILFLRPAVYAASELGSEVLWPSLETALAANTQEFQDALRGALSASEARVAGLARFGRIWRRFIFGAILDREAPRRELADGLVALVRGLSPPELVLRPGGAPLAPAASEPSGRAASISPSGLTGRAAHHTRDGHWPQARIRTADAAR